MVAISTLAHSTWQVSLFFFYFKQTSMCYVQTLLWVQMVRPSRRGVMAAGGDGKTWHPLGPPSHLDSCLLLTAIQAACSRPMSVVLGGTDCQQDRWKMSLCPKQNK